MRIGLKMTVLLLASIGLVPVARAQDAEAPSVDLRAFGGLGSGLGATGWLAGRHVRLDADAAVLTPFGDNFAWAGAAVVVPVAGGPRRFWGLRGGYELEHIGVDGAGWRGSRFANAVDASAVIHVESVAGSALEGQLGVEGVFREQAASCCDNAALATSSYGVRAAVRGELALSAGWALFAEAGLRTADHVLEIKILPTLAAGVRVRL
jgi:hypothetical protein